MTDFNKGDRVKIFGIDNTGTYLGHAYTYVFGGYGCEVELDNAARVVVADTELTAAPKEEPGIGEHHIDSRGQEYVHVGDAPWSNDNAWLRLIRTEEDAKFGRRWYSWEDIREA